MFIKVIPTSTRRHWLNDHDISLPGSECLDVSPYADPVTVLTHTNTSAQVSLTPVTWPDACSDMSHPAVKYTVFYKVLDDMNPWSDCSDTRMPCQFKVIQCYVIYL